MGGCVTALFGRRCNGPSAYKYVIGQEEIQRGTFGNLYRCVERTGNQHNYIVKKFEIQETNRAIMTHINREKRIFKRSRHFSIASYHESLTEGRWLYMVLHSFAGRDLLTEICDMSSYSERDASYYMQQILTAIEYLHLQGYIHRGLKPTDFLLRPRDKKIKLFDASLAVEISDGCKQTFVKMGSTMYTSPEVALGHWYDSQVDIWACGVILYNLLSGNHPFRSDDIRSEIKEFYVIDDVPFPDSEFDDVSDWPIYLLKGLMVRCPNERLTASEALSNPFLCRDSVSSNHDRRHTVENLRTLRAQLDNYEG